MTKLEKKSMNMKEVAKNMRAAWRDVQKFLFADDVELLDLAGCLSGLMYLHYTSGALLDSLAKIDEGLGKIIKKVQKEALK